MRLLRRPAHLDAGLGQPALQETAGAQCVEGVFGDAKTSSTRSLLNSRRMAGGAGARAAPNAAEEVAELRAVTLENWRAMA